MPESPEKLTGGTGAIAETPPARALVSITERALRRGWPISEEKRREITEQMTKLAADPDTKPRTRSIAIRSLAMLESLNLRDLHHLEKLEHESGILDLRMRRAEEGKPNDLIGIQVAPVRELPLPAALRDMRKKLLEPGNS